MNVARLRGYLVAIVVLLSCLCEYDCDGKNKSPIAVIYRLENIYNIDNFAIIVAVYFYMLNSIDQPWYL